jgi:CSLREA domain-containing protein
LSRFCRASADQQLGVLRASFSADSGFNFFTHCGRVAPIPTRQFSPAGLRPGLVLVCLLIVQAARTAALSRQKGVHAMQYETTIRHTSQQFSVKALLRQALLAAGCGAVIWLFLWASGLAQAADAQPKTVKAALTSTPFERFNWRSQPNRFPSAAFNTITVNSTEDSAVAGDTKCTLREAINNANEGSDTTEGDCAAGTSGLDTIHFALGAGTPTIILSSVALPFIIQPVVIDGQTGGAQRVELAGSQLTTNVSGLLLYQGSDGSTIRSLVINGIANGSGIGILYSSGNAVEDCYLGVSSDGLQALGNYTGIQLIDAPNNRLGGSVENQRNLISGNFGQGIKLNSYSEVASANNLIQGNYIGTDKNGTAALPNGWGVDIESSPNNLVGGMAQGARNLISGNFGGVVLGRPEAAGNVVQGNYIGTTADGLSALPNTFAGVSISGGSNNLIGGTTVAARNVISGNGNYGIQLSTSFGPLAANDNTIQGNYLGLNAIGTIALGNTFAGVILQGANGNTIGGAAPGAGNVITGNQLGIAVFNLNETTTLGNNLQANSIYGNSGLGIAHNSINGIANDPDDADTGENKFQNAPVLANLSTPGTVTGLLDSLPANSAYPVRIEFFANVSCDNAGAGEGKVYLGATLLNAPGTFNFSYAPVAGQPVITATATDNEGNTSQFSNCGCSLITLAPTTLPPGTTAQPYNQTVSASGGVGPYTFSLSGGTLPANVTLNSTTGALSGTPSTAGAFEFTLKATDANGCSGTQAYTVTVAVGCPTINLSNTTLSFTVVDTASVSTTLSAFGGVAPYSFTATGLPPGMTLTGTGATSRVLGGTPAAPGTYSLTLMATDANGCTGSRTYLLIVHSATPTLLVTTAADEFDTNPAACSLREAIIAANTNSPYGGCAAGQPGYDTIGFAEAYSIALTDGLPAPSEPVFINGLAGNERVELNGAAASATQMILLESAYHYLKSLVINRAPFSAINLNGPNALRNVIEDCYLGTNQAGTAALPNGRGIGIFSGPTLNRIGGFGVLPNVISGNSGDGVYIFSSPSNQLVSNRIGLPVTGNLALGNGGSGIRLHNSSSTAISSATIAHNLIGISVTSDGPAATGNRFLTNIMFSNTQLGIDLGADGVTANDALDADAGPNRLQNFPVLNPVTTAGTLTGSLDTAAANANYPIRLEFYANSACDTSGHGEAEMLLGVISVANATAASNFTFNYTVAQTIGKPYITAIAIDGAGNTSEFAACRQAFTCPDVTIAPETLPTALVGNDYSAQLSLNGAGVTASNSLAITGDLPPGITLNQAATRLEGTPTQPGSYTFTATWTFNDTCLTSRTYTLSVTCPAVTIGPDSLPNGVAGTPYNTQLFLVGAGVTESNTLVLTGTLPPGIMLDGAATRLEGTPTQTGSYTFTATWTFNGTCQVSRTYTLTVNCPVIAVAPATLPAGIAGQPYSQMLSQTGGLGPVNFTVSAGALPGGLTLSAAGVLSGSPTAAGVFTFTLHATDANGCTGEREYTVRICAVISLNPAILPTGTTGTPYAQTLTASGGMGPYTFALLTGSLPAGLTLSQSGVLTGTPLQSGTFNLAIQATDVSGCVGTASYALTLSCPTMTLAPVVLPAGLVERPYPASAFTATGGTAPYGYTVAGTLPPGLSLIEGVLAGTPTQRGSYLFTVTATDAAGCAAANSYTLEVRTAAVQADFDGDGKSDLSVWRGSTGSWLSLNSSNGSLQNVPWGAGYAPYFDVIVPGDYDGDGQTDQAIWRGQDSLWYIRQSSDDQALQLSFGANYAPYFDVPVPGDYDGDGKTDLAVWRPATGTWYVWKSSDNHYLIEVWGQQGDTPVPGDYDGDGQTDLAVWRGSSGTWFCKLSSGGTQVIDWGAGYAPYFDVPVAADYDGDGKTDLAIWRGADSLWYIRKSSDAQPLLKAWGANYAPYFDVPVPGDYDGDGKADIAVWRPVTGTWFVLKSADDSYLIQAHGQTGDTPVPKANLN